MSAEPTRAEITEAVSKREFDLRNFQQHKDQLALESYSQGEGECIRLARQYHARRVAFFVVNGCENDPIMICAHNVLEDGGHRLLAARHRDINAIDCVIVDCNKCLKN